MNGRVFYETVAHIVKNEPRTAKGRHPEPRGDGLFLFDISFTLSREYHISGLFP